MEMNKELKTAIKEWPTSKILDTISYYFTYSNEVSDVDLETLMHECSGTVEADTAFLTALIRELKSRQ